MRIWRVGAWDCRIARITRRARVPADGVPFRAVTLDRHPAPPLSGCLHGASTPADASPTTKVRGAIHERTVGVVVLYPRTVAAVVARTGAGIPRACGPSCWRQPQKLRRRGA